MVTIFGKNDCPYTDAVALEDYRRKGEVEHVNVKQDPAGLERIAAWIQREVSDASR
jgi:hypothetical protein